MATTSEQPEDLPGSGSAVSGESPANAACSSDQVDAAAPPCDIPRFYVADGLLADDSVGLLMKQCVVALGRQLQERINSHDVTYAQWPALAALSRRKSRTAAELARELQMDAGAMTRMLDRLEEKGLITRARDQNDRRVTLIELTSEGARAVAPIREVLADVLNETMRGFSQEEFEAFRGYLRRVHANVVTCRNVDGQIPPPEEAS